MTETSKVLDCTRFPPVSRRRQTARAKGFFAGLKNVEIMPYHTLGLGKFRALGNGHSFMSEAKPRLLQAVDIRKDAGIEVEVPRY
jgi:hypothetical protein